MYPSVLLQVVSIWLARQIGRRINCIRDYWRTKTIADGYVTAAFFSKAKFVGYASRRRIRGSNAISVLILGMLRPEISITMCKNVYKGWRGLELTVQAFQGSLAANRRIPQQFIDKWHSHISRSWEKSRWTWWQIVLCTRETAEQGRIFAKLSGPSDRAL